jgi:hypothetical protein
MSLMLAFLRTEYTPYTATTISMLAHSPWKLPAGDKHGPLPTDNGPKLFD